MSTSGKEEISPKRVALVGSVGVGKSTLWSLLCADAGRDRTLQLPNTSVKVPIGTLRGGLLTGWSEEAELLDTPGFYSLFTRNEDERVARQLLLTVDVDALVLVLDAKNLRRSLVLAFQFAEFGLPMSLVLNMLDEAKNRGIEISVRGLSERLGVEVGKTVAKERMGVDDVPSLLSRAKPCVCDAHFPPSIQTAIERLTELLDGAPVPPRALAVLLLGGSLDARETVEATHGRAVLAAADRLIEALQHEFGRPLDVVITESYHAAADKLVRQVQRIHRRSRPFLDRLGRWSQQISTGIPIALAILVSMYFWVGAFGATLLVDLINNELFNKLLIPWFEALVEPIPSAFIRGALVDPDFGVLTTGLFLAFGIVMPVLFCFYLFFGLLEESGYLPRFSVLVHRAMQRVGLNGKGIIPLVMGLSCVTMAILTTRMLDTRRERVIATFLLMLGLPCAPLIGVMMIILGRMPWYATVFVFGFIILQTVIAGVLAQRFLPGERADFLIELPPMRVPRLRTVVLMTWRRTIAFMKEALPLFLFAAFLVFVFHFFGGLAVVERGARPLMDGVLGLPDESVRVFIKTIIRRESGAAELDHLRGSFTNLQLIVTLLVMTFLVPCVNAVIVTFKELGTRATLVLLAIVCSYAIVLGGVANHGCRLLGITFG